MECSGNRLRGVLCGCMLVPAGRAEAAAAAGAASPGTAAAAAAATRRPRPQWLRGHGHVSTSLHAIFNPSESTCINEKQWLAFEMFI